MIEYRTGIEVRHISLKLTGLVVGHNLDRPIIRYENGWVMVADPNKLIKGHYEKRWIDDEPLKSKRHKHDTQIFAGNGKAYYYCADRECGWKQDYH